MPRPYPKEPQSFSEQINDLSTGLDKLSNVVQNQFSASEPPSPNGFASRQSRVASGRTAVKVRNLIRWLVPNSGIVEMYVNPNAISYKFQKLIIKQRTKGGYILQYWGEELPTVGLTGTTGTSGIEGINVLHDVYRAEQLAYDPYALILMAEQDKKMNQDNANDTLGILGQIGGLLSDATGPALTVDNRPTLAQLAFGVEMYYSGWVFRGYFTDMTVNESAANLGFFDYSLNFVVTQRRGFRENFLQWHHSATSGPSGDRPFSYEGLENGFLAPSQQKIREPGYLLGSGTTAGVEEAFGGAIRI